ncbi:hypothetical protein A3B18_00735 [Candidatus Giovannonibacteria bacterium RIFCSPLOWO2_01_FULL_46_13]|uniref:Uncharacterized protein n=1 Tax=Candidatus Giovannonibacteria bacterium RIFCSPLOWO2_01_FULL_46_13 TaxID=1798352 RepID=A0A1F5X3M5_9BACT|nr:MAG: hypothetical protein A3B18_00735 [Candidatus Giovannonibacteria bacterium RIFCSPLOWO2_01_FULL_46_13]
MKRLISKKIEPIHYSSASAIVWCFDARFSEFLDSLVSKKKLDHPDIVKVAGGAKGIASPENAAERDYLLDQIDKSFRLHKPKEVHLMVHAGCGAYGKKFSDEEKEKKFYLGELDKAEKVLKVYLRGKGHKANIVKCFADFGGVLW